MRLILMFLFWFIVIGLVIFVAPFVFGALAFVAHWSVVIVVGSFQTWPVYSSLVGFSTLLLLAWFIYRGEKHE